MNTYRRMAMAMMTGAAGLSLAACSVAITTAGPKSSPSPTASRTRPSATASATRPASPRPSPTPTVSVNAPIGGFPIPPGAQVVYNVSCPKSISISVSPVTPAESSAFYATALPRFGYTIKDSMTLAAQGLVEIDFSGHGYTGAIATLADAAAAASADPSAAPVTLPSDMTKNLEQVTMTVPGLPDSYVCPDGL
ncbi:MAG TPA: hypothetical protein VMU95_16125 [Trebonia sp.]|nr:hypothetical protein [Trebonia sp.]